ncbi:MAG: hypothetical protein MRECE_12c010 [Mycoplasmataceae bacterium CE_OT135]|nr:MAG: hypothetical protein MRECE_12c010 [Mycoplasmataceae bacterium CE_OT135]
MLINSEPENLSNNSGSELSESHKGEAKKKTKANQSFLFMVCWPPMFSKIFG